MKRLIFYLFSFVCMIGVLSCDDFLDVSSSEKILQKDLFNDYSGFRIAVNGIYKKISSKNLYGQNLSWGFMSALGHNYEVGSSTLGRLLYTANFDWESSYTLSYCESIWKSSYNIIAGCNNIIQETEAKDSLFFAEKSIEKNMILGEMYGVRAMMHFDLLRLFVPAPIMNYTGSAIPYVTKYPDKSPLHLTRDEVLEKIIEDMRKAQELLAPIDTIKFKKIMSSPSGRYRQKSTYISLKEGIFFNYRGERMNFFGATALLARIYMYMQDYDNAFSNADLVYKFHKRNWFKWTPALNQGQSSNLDVIHPKRPNELLLMFSNNKNYDNFYTHIGSSLTLFKMKKMDQLFEGDLDDYRYSGFYNRYGVKRYLTWIRPSGTTSQVQSIIESQGPLIPIIRISEMYHILIESYINSGKIVEAVDLFNDLRLARGAKTKIAKDIDPTELMNKLVNDIVRETLTEGQTFFMYKRLNRNIFNGDSEIVMEPQFWTLPIPHSETGF